MKKTSLNKYGYAADKWVAAKKEACEILIRRAKAEDTIAYSELTEKIKTISIEPHSYAIGAFLGEISESENEIGRGMLSVIVVYKEGDMQPGPGFFDLAKQLGRDTSDKTKCWVGEFRQVCDYWKAKAR